ncbi:heavy-metal-associated domain-containing protein [Flaviflexus huanghaiensis]|uniref:heavy-metal-associated domain-containing protein n=1 Tax=Flaviflexus huanghaiensis TaxID=1111473 RepID=UPI001F507E6E|nr:heavy metal-associated domain-containing protein [Flaviflexus huanghaiensis]
MSATTLLRAQGFSCPSCVDKLEKALGKIDGVDSVDVQFATGKITVGHAESVNAQLLADTVTKSGYPAKVAAF